MEELKKSINQLNRDMLSAQFAGNNALAKQIAEEISKLNQQLPYGGACSLEDGACENCGS